MEQSLKLSTGHSKVLTKLQWVKFELLNCHVELAHFLNSTITRTYSLEDVVNLIFLKERSTIFARARLVRKKRCIFLFIRFTIPIAWCMRISIKKRPNSKVS